MPAPHTDRRPDAIDWAKENGWTFNSKTYDGEVIRDQFIKGDRELRCYWLDTPFADAMWARGYLLLPFRAVTVPRVTSQGSRPSVEAVLKLQHKYTKGI